MGSAWNVVDVSRHKPLEIELLFLFPEGITVTNFLVSGGSLFPPPLLSAGILSGLRGPLCTVTISVRSSVLQSCYVWEMLFPWSHPTILAFIFLLPLPHLRCLSMEKTDLVKTTHLMRSVPKSLSLFIVQLCFFIFSTIKKQEEASLMMAVQCIDL